MSTWLVLYVCVSVYISGFNVKLVLTGNTVNVYVYVFCSACLGSRFLFSPHDDSRLKPVCLLFSFRYSLSNVQKLTMTSKHTDCLFQFDGQWWGFSLISMVVMLS